MSNRRHPLQHLTPHMISSYQSHSHPLLSNSRGMQGRGNGLMMGGLDWGKMGQSALSFAKSDELAPVRQALLNQAMSKLNGSGYSSGGLLLEGSGYASGGLLLEGGVRRPKKKRASSAGGKSAAQIHAERLRNLAKARAVKAAMKNGSGYTMY